MPEIIPAIIAKSFEELEEKVKLVEPCVSWVQLDVMDGKFAPQVTWDEPNELKKIETNVKFEVHLMVEDAIGEVERWAGSGVKRILAHIESFISNVESQNSNPQHKCQNLIKKCQAAGVEFGLVLNLETPIEVLNELESVISYQLSVIQLMSIAQIGYYGEVFDEKVIHKIELLRQGCPNVKISIDGGLDEKTIYKVAKVGADNFVVGSAIFNSENIKETIEEFKKKINS